MRKSNKRARGIISRVINSGLVRTAFVVILAVVLALVAVLGVHWLALKYAVWLQLHAPWVANLIEDKIGGFVVDAVTAATASAGTVYVLTVSIIVRDVKDQIHLSIREGFLGNLNIPDLAKVVRQYMTRLDYLIDSRRALTIPLDTLPKVEEWLPKQNYDPDKYDSVALSLNARQRYTAKDLIDVLKLLRTTFNRLRGGLSQVRHIVVIDGGNIVAAYDLWDDSETSLISDPSVVAGALELVERGKIWYLHLYGFVTERFDVTNTPLQLLNSFANRKAAKALLYFSNERTGGKVVGTIALWDLVRLALDEDFVPEAPHDGEGLQRAVGSITG